LIGLSGQSEARSGVFLTTRLEANSEGIRKPRILYEINGPREKQSETIIRADKPLRIRHVRGARPVPRNSTVQSAPPSLSAQPETFAEELG
jgi:hypothetical protein